jgi:uncharacterized protein YkwD
MKQLKINRILPKAVLSGTICFLSGFLLLSQSTGKAPTDFKNFRKQAANNEVIDFSHIDFERIELLIFHLTNEVRLKNNLKPLEYSEELAKTARMHAFDMVSGNFFDHINNRSSKRRTPDDRARLNKISNPHINENIIEGYALQYKALDKVFVRGKGEFSITEKGPLIRPHTYLTFCEDQIDKWMNSPGHRKNILSKDALQLGCGAAFFLTTEFNDMPTFYIVQNFQCFEPVQKD